MRSNSNALAVLVLSLAACAGSDLGAPCRMPASVEGGDPAFDYLYLGAPECEEQVCLRRSGDLESTCSRACLDAADCAPGWSCERLVPRATGLVEEGQTRFCVRWQG